ncbi:phage baseplate upper protein [Lentilactobacillus kefiri]|uniref:phage baseplate upper protein n=1 Tax=Lentilactobacillus kefiri TaxID=33962 RepID=UPI001CDA9461|nr:phage baseplate upper protein [Lentilactobacillus kefiri]
MSKELAFTDDNDVVKYLDTTTAFNLALTADGVAFDLTNAKSILVKIANDDGYIMQQTIDLTTVTSPLGGTLSFPINQDIMNTLVPDDYDIEVWVTMNDGTQAIFPSDGTLGFSIEENLMSDTGEVIPTITLNDFQQQFNDLSNQMENAVHNVQKGDQGNPGNGIKSANNQYQLSDSPVTVPTGGWSDTILATTDQLPYLWTKIIFIYDDGTTKETNFVSSRGDTGSQGPIGPVGPQGKQGNGLVVRGKADKEENLPTTGNNQGDGYLVGTDLYIWIDGSWQNMGSITPDLADYVKVADMNNALNTKVNVTDMRKPASDVAGIEEVNAKQDAIGYTPADDSKVVHDNHDGTITANGTVFNLLNSLSASSIPQNPTKDYNTLPQGLALMSEVNGEPANMPPVKSTYLTLTIASSFATGRKRQLAWLDAGANSSNNNYTYIRYCVGNTWSSWDSIPTSTQISSLIPSTIADTTKDANFTRKLQKSGIDVATKTDVTNAVNTATSNVVTTNKLANFTAGLQSGGVSVATSDDLKSVENSAWHQLSMPDCNGMRGITLLYRNFISDHYMNLYAYGIAINSGIKGPTMLDLSSLIDKIESVSGVVRDTEGDGYHIFYDDSLSSVQGVVDLVVSGNKLTLGTNVTINMNDSVIVSGDGSPFAKVKYDNWIGS